MYRDVIEVLQGSCKGVIARDEGIDVIFMPAEILVALVYSPFSNIHAQ